MLGQNFNANYSRPHSMLERGDIEINSPNLGFPSSRPNIPLGKKGDMLPSLGLSTRHWMRPRNGVTDQAIISGIHSILEQGLDQFNSVLIVIEPPADNREDCINSGWLAKALSQLADHSNLKNLKLVLNLPANKVAGWINGTGSNCLSSRNPSQPPKSPQSDTSTPDLLSPCSLTSSDGVVVLSTHPVPLLLISPPSRGKIPKIHLTGLLSRTYCALTAALDSGRASNVGLAGFRFGHITSLNRKLVQNNYPGIAAVQVDFSVVNRQAETTYFVDYCQKNGIAILAMDPLPNLLRENVYGNEREEEMGYPPSAAELFMMLSDPGFMESSPQPRSRSVKKRNTPLTNLVTTLGELAESRMLPWEAIAINYVMVKGLIPIMEPLSLQELDKMRQSVGWRLTAQELTKLDRASLPVSLMAPSISVDKRSSNKFSLKTLWQRKPKLLLPPKKSIANKSRLAMEVLTECISPKSQRAEICSTRTKPITLTPSQNPITIRSPANQKINIVISPILANFPSVTITIDNNQQKLPPNPSGNTTEWKTDLRIEVFSPKLQKQPISAQAVAAQEVTGTVSSFPGLDILPQSPMPHRASTIHTEDIDFPSPPRRAWGPVPHPDESLHISPEDNEYLGVFSASSDQEEVEIEEGEEEEEDYGDYPTIRPHPIYPFQYIQNQVSSSESSTSSYTEDSEYASRQPFVGASNLYHPSYNGAMASSYSFSGPTSSTQPDVAPRPTTTNPLELSLSESASDDESTSSTIKS